MFDLFCDIWKEPGAAYAPYVVLCISGDEAADKVSAELNRMYRAGAGGVVIRHRGDFCERYFSLLNHLLEKAKNRGMSVIIETDAGVLEGKCPGRGRLCSQDVMATRAGSVPAYRVFRKTDNGRTSEVSLSAEDESLAYDIGYISEGAPDVFDRAYSEEFISSILERYSENCGGYFGNTVIGFMAGKIGGECAFPRSDGLVPWNFRISEEFISGGGDPAMLLSLVEEPKVKKTRREAEHLMRQILAGLYGECTLDPLRKWCDARGLLLFADPADPRNTDILGRLSAPGAHLTDLYGAKLAADCARHRGLPRCYGILDPDENLSDVQDRICKAVIAGCNMLVFDGGEDNGVSLFSTEKEDNLRILTGFVKRMSWLAASGSDEPEAAVLCSLEHLPERQSDELLKAGYHFNYLTARDLVEKAHIHGGEIRADRYRYGTVLVDSGMRIDERILTRLGEFIAGGGICHRNGAFASAVLSQPRHDRFRSEDSSQVLTARYRKSGCDFVVFCNTGDEPASGEYMTGNSTGAKWFCPVTGEIRDAVCGIADSGFSYKVRIPAGGSAVLGFDPGSLPCTGNDETVPELVCSEAVSPLRETFEAVRGFSRAEISACSISGFSAVYINGEKAGVFSLRPYVIDITGKTREGINSVKFDGRPEGVVVRFFA